jgi:hypothetical protein
MHGRIDVIEAKPEPTKLPFEPTQQIWLSIIIIELFGDGESSNHAKRSREEDAAHQVGTVVLPKRYHEVLEPKQHKARKAV